MKSFISVAALALLASMPGVLAHIDMQDPPPIRHKLNKFATSVDNDYTAPVKEICKGYQKLSGADLTPVAKWEAGSQQKFTLGGSAVHGGGSCQASISEDGGATFKAIKTYIGDCPHADGAAGTFDFTVPKETKPGPVLFAWTWFNKVGNREMYMNCASIEITGGGSGLSSYPNTFIANIANGCTTADGKDVEIPNPGKDVVISPKAATAPPVGSSCGPAGPSPPTEKKPETVAPPPVDKTVTPPPVDKTAPPPPVDKTAIPPPVDKTAPPPPVDKTVPPPPVGQKPENGTTPPQTSPPIVDPPKEVKMPVDVNAPPSSVPTTQPPPKNEKNAPPPPPPAGGSCTTGSITCTSETTWSLCTNGSPVPMGAVAAGTKCVGGAITKRSLIRFSKDHMARRF